MLTIVVYGLPERPIEIESLQNKLLIAAAKITHIAIEEIEAFFPANRMQVMKTDIRRKIVIIVENFHNKVTNRTDKGMRDMLAEALGRAVKEACPLGNIVCNIKPFSKDTHGFWSSNH